MYKIGFLGGDRREEVLARYLAKRGCSLYCLGAPPAGFPLTRLPQKEQFMDECDLFIGPMSGTDEEGVVKASFPDAKIVINEAFLRRLGPDKPVFIGTIPDNLLSCALSLGVPLVVTGRLEELAVLNAIPTAEGSIQIAISESPKTIFGSVALIMGLGRVGRPLGRRLLALGAKVYGISRSRESIAWGKELGIDAITYEQLEAILPEIDFLFNTIPALVLKREYLQKFNKEGLIVDLASAPGGVDFQAAKERGLKALLCPGLPGKTAPVTAGEILCQVYPPLIDNLLDKKRFIKDNNNYGRA